MAKKKTDGPKIELEREYNVPLRKGWLKVPKYKRGAKAVKTLKEFLVRHMKVYDRDLRKIKLDILLNNEIRFRGMKKPPAYIKVKAKKFDNGIVKVELAELPDKIRFQKEREEKKSSEIKKKVETKAEERNKIEETTKKEEKEESSDDKEKEKTSRDEGLKISEMKAKEMKHVSIDKKVVEHRKALAR